MGTFAGDVSRVSDNGITSLSAPNTDIGLDRFQLWSLKINYSAQDVHMMATAMEEHVNQCCGDAHLSLTLCCKAQRNTRYRRVFVSWINSL